MKQSKVIIFYACNEYAWNSLILIFLTSIIEGVSTISSKVPGFNHFACTDTYVQKFACNLEITNQKTGSKMSEVVKSYGYPRKTDWRICWNFKLYSDVSWHFLSRSARPKHSISNGMRKRILWRLWTFKPNFRKTILSKVMNKNVNKITFFVWKMLHFWVHLIDYWFDLLDEKIPPLCSP